DKHEIKEHSLSVLDRQWKESSELLNKRLHIYHIHSATLESGVLDNQEVLDRLWQLRNSGIIIGLSMSGEQQSETLEKALTIKTVSEYLFQSAQVSWNVLEQSCSAMLTKAASTGMGIIVKEALANGRLTERNQDPACGDKMNVLNTLAEKYNTGIDALCMAFALAQPWASVVLSGASTEKQLLSNLKAESVNMDQKDLTTLSGLAESSAEYWKSRAGLKWN
ncbi:MAG: aldo/keto reductase, partial [Cytophagaceae bacterium]